MVQEAYQGAVVKTQDSADEFPKTMEFYFDIIQEHSISLQNQITDNYIENNTAVQDHIAKSPLVVSLRGLIGEIVFTPPTSFLTEIKEGLNKSTGGNFGAVSEKLGPLSAILPEVSNLDQLARNAVQYTEASVNRYKKIYNSFFSKKTGKLLPEFQIAGNKETRLQEVYRKLSVLRNSNALLTVLTPYDEEPMRNMVIQSVTLRQGNEKFVSDIEMTLKQIKFARTETTKPDEKVMAKYNAIQRTQEANHGKAQGTEANNSYFYNNVVKGKKYKTLKDYQ